jgi:hypothetical protein
MQQRLLKVLHLLIPDDDKAESLFALDKIIILFILGIHF